VKINENVDVRNIEWKLKVLDLKDLFFPAFFVQSFKVNHTIGILKN
jgi:hypothetical protein